MQLPAQLAYQRSIDPSDVIFHVLWPDGNISPLKKHTRTVNGMKEGHAAAFTSDGEIQSKITSTNLAESNIHEVDFCSIPYGAKELLSEFSISFTPELLVPYKCSDKCVSDTLNELVTHYGKKVGWTELVERYLINICNGSWLWSNTKKAYSIDIEVTPWPWSENPLVFSGIHKNFNELPRFKNNKYWGQLVQVIATALTTPSEACTLEIKACLRLPTCASIRPSQAFVENSNESNARNNSRIYQTSEINGLQSPIMGCYKTGAAIAMIDDWYPNAEKKIRVGHYGVDKQSSTSYRSPDTGKDLFTLLRQADEFVGLLKSKKKLTQEEINDLHFIIANLIKGGLLQQKGN